MTPIDMEYLKLEKEFISRRDVNLTEIEHDQYLERLDDLWWQMSKEGRAASTERAAFWNTENKKAVAAERERCAKIAEDHSCNYRYMGALCPEEIAAKIRSTEERSST